MKCFTIISNDRQPVVRRGLPWDDFKSGPILPKGTYLAQALPVAVSPELLVERGCVQNADLQVKLEDSTRKVTLVPESQEQDSILVAYLSHHNRYYKREVDVAFPEGILFVEHGTKGSYSYGNQAYEANFLAVLKPGQSFEVSTRVGVLQSKKVIANYDYSAILASGKDLVC